MILNRTFNAYSVDESQRLQELAARFLVNSPKPSNDGLRTLLAIALDIPFYTTFTVSIRLTTAIHHPQGPFPHLIRRHHCPVDLIGTFDPL